MTVAYNPCAAASLAADQIVAFTHNVIHAGPAFLEILNDIHDDKHAALVSKESG